MIVVSARKNEEDEEDDAWQGSINKVVSQTKRYILNLENELKKNMNEQHTAVMSVVNTKTHDIETKVKEN